MLKNIKLHLANEETVQEDIDKAVSKQIIKNQTLNINAFQRFTPSLLPLLSNLKTSNISIFGNKHGEINIVDYGLGRTFYGFHPKQETVTHLEQFTAHPFCVELEDSISNESPSKLHQTVDTLRSLPAFERRLKQTVLPKHVECIVVLGCGLGHHIPELLNRYQIQHLIIYEPEIQYFQCSGMAVDWSAIFSTAKQKGTTLYFQIGKDGRDIVSDISELKKVSDIKRFYVYQHYHHTVFRSIVNGLSENTWPWLLEHGISFDLNANYLDFLPNWTPVVNLNRYTDVDTNHPKFVKNLVALQKYFPDIHREFHDYTPDKWMPLASETGEINILHKKTLAPWYSESPLSDANLHYQNFNLQPNKDGLILGYTGKKLAHYLHYKFVAKTEKILKEVEEIEGCLPAEIKSIILFGLGSGYQLECLFENHSIENLFICEPNRDFFYASLFAIDWSDILEKLEACGARIYLNIGDDGSNLMQDLLNQFHSIGPYLLNNTYFYQTYYNSSLNQAIAQLREQLKIVIAMGEYFDHAYFGITQTRHLSEKSVPALVSNPANRLSYAVKEVPIMLVGNGPSIDDAIEHLKEYRDQVILVSCGTVLQVLHRHGITPDFHAEIEQNRATYDWAVLIDDADYLKEISLISCNGIHPDTASLYKDTYVAFKEGESSTVVALSILGEEKFDTLKFSFPTVANFVIDLFSKLEFTSIYLVGVDLGFVNQKHHHSKKSAYYTECGEELYDYALENNTSIVVQGNFRPTVYTKHEFKVAKMMMEQTLSHRRKHLNVYNTSDGAKIFGAIPLKIEDLLVTSSDVDKSKALEQIKTKAFNAIDGDKFAIEFSQKFLQSALLRELDSFSNLLSEPPTTIFEAEKFIEKQKLKMFAAYERGDNLLFYYLYGTSNYANAVFYKLLNHESEDKDLSEAFTKAFDLWRQSFNSMQLLMASNQRHLDTSNFSVPLRESKVIMKKATEWSLLVISDSDWFKNSVRANIDTLKWPLSIKIISFNEVSSIGDNAFDFLLIDNERNTIKPTSTALKNFPKVKQRTLLTLFDVEPANVFIEDLPENTSVLLMQNSPLLDNGRAIWRSDPTFVCYYGLAALIQNHDCTLILPRYVINKSFEKEFIAKYNKPTDEDNLHFSPHRYYICARPKEISRNKILNGGSRDSFLPHFPEITKMIGYCLEDDIFTEHCKEAQELQLSSTDKA